MTVCESCKHANYCEVVRKGESNQVKGCRDYREKQTNNGKDDEE